MLHRKKITAMVAISTTLLFFSGCDRSNQQPNFDQVLTEAQSYLIAGQIQSAVIEGRNLLQIRPESTEALNLLGDIYFTVGDYKNASRYYEQSLDLTANEQIRILYADALTRRGQGENARSILSQVTANPNNPELLRIQGDIALTSGQPSEAQKYYEQALAVNQNHSESLLGLARAAYLQGDKATTQERLNSAVASKADYVDALLFRGHLLLQGNEADRAEESFSKALAAQGKFDVMTAQKYQSIQGLAKSYVDQGRTEEALRLNKTLADSPQGKVQQAIQNALDAYEQGDAETAQENFEEVLQYAPQHQLSNLGLGMIKLKQGDIETAEHLLSQASEDLNGINEPAFVALTLARLQLGKQDAAQKILSAALKKFPESKDLRLINASMTANQGDTMAASKIVDGLLAEDENHADALYLKAQMELNAGNLPQAQTLFSKVITARPSFFPAYSGLFRSYYKQPNVARDKIQQLLKSQKEPIPSTQLALGVAYTLTKEHNKAEEIARSLLKTAPNNTMFKNLLGAALYEQALVDSANDKLQAAYIKVKEAVKSSPRDRHVTLMTRLAVELQRADEAVTSLQSLIESEPDFALGHELLSDLMVASNNQQAAVTHARDAWDIQPSFRRGVKLFQLKKQEAKESFDLAITAKHLTEWRDTAKAEYEAAEEDMKKATAATYESSLFALSSIYEQHELEQEAIDIYSTLIELRPNSALYLNNIAWLKFTQDQPEAVEHAKKAFDLAPDTGEIIDTYGWILVQSGETEKGLELLKLAREKSPNNPLIQQHFEQASEMRSKSI